MNHKTEYLATGGAFCPFCKNKDIEGGPVIIDADEAVQDVSCLACDKVWTDVYRLADVEERG